jgi:SAM-dependent methyltransferase
VDCGAGTGRNLDWLQTYAPAVGIERSWTGLRVGRASRRRLVRATVTALPIADASVDLATSFDVLYCLDDASERQAVKEMWRILKPGGLVIVNVAALDILRGSHSTLTMEVRRYTRRSLAALLRDAGFVIERLTFANMATFPIALGVRLFERMTGRAETASDADLRVPNPAINAILNGTLWVENRLLRAVNLPVGSSLLCVARKPLSAS